MRRRLGNLAYWTVVVACVELAAGELIAWIRFALVSDLQGPDFFSYYAISLLLLKRGPALVYDFGVQKQFQDQVTSQWQGHFILLPHLLPPWVTLVLYPLGLLPYRTAYLVWGATILLLVGAAIAMLLRAAGLKGRGAILGAAAAAASLPVYVVLLQGQSDALMIAAVAGAALAWTAARPAWAGVFTVLALVKPQLVVLLPVFFLARRSWRALGAFTAGSALLVALSLAVFGFSACLAWLGILAPWAFAGQANFPVDTQAQYSLRGLLQLLGAPLVLQLALLALGLIGLAAVFLRAAADPRLEVALAMAGSVAMSPYQHAHDLALLIVPGLLLGGALPALRHPRLGAGVLLAGWLGLELLVFVPVLTACAIVAGTLFLAYECLRPAGHGQLRPGSSLSG